MAQITHWLMGRSQYQQGTPGNITIASIVDDALDEDNETVILSLSSPSNANLGSDDTHTYTITDNDDAPTVEFYTTSQLILSLYHRKQ